jgi:2,3-bisphosphoglycerate-dependent phosphoglycerate mutase
MLVVVRHAEAEVRVVGGPSEERRRLTVRGRGQAGEIVEVLARFAPAEIHFSPYERAVATIVPTAERVGVGIQTRWELREWDDGLVTREDWRALYDRCWRDPRCSYGDGESHVQLADRARGAMSDLLDRAEGRCVIAASHGTWIARGLQGLGLACDHDFWERMPFPAVYVIHQTHRRITAAGPGLTDRPEPQSDRSRI